MRRKKERGYLCWMTEGRGGNADRIAHAYDDRTAFSHNFTALCGTRWGALNGASANETKCEECEREAPKFVSDCKRKEREAYDRWFKSLTRKRLMSKLSKALETATPESMRDALTTLKRWDDVRDRYL